MTTAMPMTRFIRGEVLEMLRLGRLLGVGFVEILPIRPAGRAVVQCAHGELTPSAGRDVDRIVRDFNSGREHEDLPSLATPAYLESPERFGCVAGTERLFISTAGDVQPCPLVNLSVGNVVREDFRVINDRLRGLLAKPRREQLCMQLDPAVRQYVSQRPGEIDLPVDERTSCELLKALPASPLPDAYA